MFHWRSWWCDEGYSSKVIFFNPTLKWNLCRCAKRKILDSLIWILFQWDDVKICNERSCVYSFYSLLPKNPWTFLSRWPKSNACFPYLQNMAARRVLGQFLAYFWPSLDVACAIGGLILLPSEQVNALGWSIQAPLFCVLIRLIWLCSYWFWQRLRTELAELVGLDLSVELSTYFMKHSHMWPTYPWLCCAWCGWFQILPKHHTTATRDFGPSWCLVSCVSCKQTGSFITTYYTTWVKRLQ